MLLHVNHNSLKGALPESLGQLSDLSELHVHQNQLTSIPLAVCEAGLLAELRAEGNPLVQPPIEECLDPLTKVSDLDSMLAWYEHRNCSKTVKQLGTERPNSGGAGSDAGSAGGETYEINVNPAAGGHGGSVAPIASVSGIELHVEESDSAIR